MTFHPETRMPFAANTHKVDKRKAGRTDAADTPLQLRTIGHGLEPGLHDWVYDRLSRQLGKYAPHIERIQVRFGDENGPRGGPDRVCSVHLILSKLPPVIIEVRAETEREAFDLAAARVERAMRRNVQRHGYSSRPAGHKELGGAHEVQPQPGVLDGEVDSAASLFGRHVGRSTEQLLALAERPEKERRDLQVDTSEVGTSATDRRAGYGHTGKRNTKLNTAGMAYRLEDSTTDRPTRKSTRGGQHVKPDANLMRRARSSVTSSKARAGRAIATRGH